jgi:uroporphyrinogen decarboxylase
MTSRERFLETLLFGKPDRIPFVPGWPRESTLKRWRAEGLPESADWLRYLCDQIGIEPPNDGGPGVQIRHTMIPEFEEKVIEEKEDSIIVQDWKGNICEISNQFDVTYLRSARDFCTRKWIKCPVESWDDWELMKTRYDPEDPSRVPADLPELGKQLAERDHVVGVHVHGPFWQLREWMGFEGLCAAFLDDPDLVRDMIGFWTDYISVLLSKVTAHVRLDYFYISEDMAYKQHAMISPEMTRSFLGPCYSAWRETVDANDCPLYMVDSDGYVGELIPVWIESGINVTDPMEVAAGNDMGEFRKSFGRTIAFRGGVDKRAIAKGGEVISRELARLEPVVRDGGYIPGCDHGVPSDVGWSQMIEYADGLARITGWK